MTGRTRTVLSRLQLAPQADPRAVQAGFTLLFALDLGLRILGGVELGNGTRASLLLALLVCVAALLTPWQRAPGWAMPALLVIDVGLVGMSRLSPEGGSALLVVVPALWLGYVYGRRGAAVAAVATVLLVTLPGLFYIGTSGINVSRSVVIPVIAAVASFTIADALERVRGGQETIEHQQRVADAILDTVDVGLVLLDRSGGYTTVNKRHLDFMRLAYPEGHAGRAGQVGEVFHEDGVTPVAHEEMPTYRASQGEEFDDQLIWVGSDPVTRRALSVSARAVRDDGGAFTGAALAYKDVTDFMRALRVKDDFVASVSHELRTPLTSIHGFTSLVLERDDLSEEVVRHLHVVTRNVDRLDRLVSDLLHTAQATSGLMHVVRVDTDLASLVREAVEAARPSVEAAGLALTAEIPDELIAKVDAQRMSQVVDNLLSNAVKYTPAGGRVWVGLATEDDRVELIVSDTGIGIGPADRDRLFRRFFRARHAEEQSIQGVGLGLSITKEIVESHGGRIEVVSEVGQGSVFRVRLPLDAVAASDAQTQAGQVPKISNV